MLAAVAAVALLVERPPEPRAADAPAQAFSAVRAMPVVDDLARAPRPIGSPASDAARDALVARLAAQGLAVRVEAGAGALAEGGTAIAGRVENVVAALPGTAPTGAVVLMAHYDSVATGPGAADDLSSVAAILETVRALRAGPALRNDLVVVLTDGEEVGLLGAQAWVRDELAPSRRPTVTVNLEARGVAGPSLMFQTSPGNAGLVEAFLDGVDDPTGDSSLVEAYRLLPNDTDLSTVLDAGRPGLNSAFVERPIEYHTTGDSPANLDPASLQHHGETALGLARALGARDLAPLDPAVSGLPRDDDVTWFRLLGLPVVLPQTTALPIALLAAAAVLAAAVLGRARGRLRLRDVLAAAGVTVLAAAVGVVAALGLWQGLLLLRPSYADTGPFLDRPLPFQLADVAVAVLVVGLGLLARSRRAGPFATATGAAAVLAALGVVTAVLVPGTSFLLAVPALGLGIGWTAAVLLSGRPWAALAVATLGAVPAVALLVPLGWSLFVLAGISDGVPVAVLVLVGLAVVPVAVRPSRAVPVVALVAAVVLAGAGLAVDEPSPAHPQRTHLAHVLDADTGTARWLSADTAPAPWTAGYLDTPPATVAAWPGEGPARTGPAPVADRRAPVVDVVERSPGRRVLRLASPRGAPTLVVRADRPIAAVTVAFPGRPPVSTAVDGTTLRLEDVPADGVRVEVVPAAPGPLTLEVADAAPGLAAVPGFVPRPPGLRPSPRRDGELTVVARRVVL